MPCVLFISRLSRLQLQDRIQIVRLDVTLGTFFWDGMRYSAELQGLLPDIYSYTHARTCAYTQEVSQTSPC